MARFNLLSRTTWVSLGQGVTKLTELGIVLVLVRLLTEQQWQQLALVLSIYSAAIGIGGLNLHQGIFFFYGRLGRDRRRLLAIQTSGLLFVSGLVTSGIVASLEWFLRDGPYYIEGVFLWLALAILIQLPTVGIPQLLLAAERPGRSAAVNAVLSVLLGAVVIAPLALGLPVKTAVFCLVGYSLVRLVALVAVILATTRSGDLSFDKALLIEQVVYTAPLGLAIGTAVLNRNLDKWVVAAFDAENFGTYVLAAQEVPFVPILPYAIGAVLATRMVHAFKEGRPHVAREYWMASTSRMSLVVLPVTVGLIVCAEPLMELLFTSDYRAAALPFQIYTVILLHRVAEYGVVLRASGDTRSLWWSSFVLLGVNAVLSVPLTMGVGMVGAAIATLIANAAAWLFILSRIAKSFGVSFGEAFPWKSYAAILALSAAAGLVAGGIGSHFSLPALLDLALRAAVFAGFATGAIFALRMPSRVPPVPEDDADFLREIAD